MNPPKKRPALERVEVAKIIVHFNVNPITYPCMNVEIVLELHEQGKSLRSIAAIMEARGIASRTGIKWHHDTINRIVKFAEKKVA